MEVYNRKFYQLSFQEHSWKCLGTSTHKEIKTNGSIFNEKVWVFQTLGKIWISKHEFSSSIEYKFVSWTLLAETKNISKKIIDTIENKNKMRNTNLNT